jgi:hypothetical protein
MSWTAGMNLESCFRKYCWSWEQNIGSMKIDGYLNREIGSVFAGDALSLLIYDVGAAPSPKHSLNRKHSTIVLH